MLNFTIGFLIGLFTYKWLESLYDKHVTFVYTYEDLKKAWKDD